MHVRKMLVLAPCLAALACSSKPPQLATAPATAMQAAVVRHLAVEGGCWVLETAGGNVQPLGLPEELKKDGQRVLVVLEDVPEMATICQAGPVKRVVTIRGE